MKRQLRDGLSRRRGQLALALFVSSASVSAQTAEPATPKQDQATVAPQPPTRSSKNSFPVHFDATPTGLVNTPTAIETTGGNLGSPGKAEQQLPDEKHSKRGEIVVAPFPISNPALGSGLVLVGGYLFPISKKDDESPDSMLGGGSFYTSNGSWLWGAGTKLYLKQDRLRVTAFYGQGQLHYDLYGIGNSAGNLGSAVPV